jgi:hypothetical protein
MVEREQAGQERRDESRRGRHECLRHIPPLWHRPVTGARAGGPLGMASVSMYLPLESVTVTGAIPTGAVPLNCALARAAVSRKRASARTGRECCIFAAGVRLGSRQSPPLMAAAVLASLRRFAAHCGLFS